MLFTSFFLRNPFYFIFLVALGITVVLVWIVDGGFQEHTLQEVNPELYSLRSLLRNSNQEDTYTDESSTKSAENVDWDKYAYVQYATSQDYLCNAIMVFEQLKELQTKADRVLIYPDYWGVPDQPTAELAKNVVYKIEKQTTNLLRDARDKYDVKLRPVKVLEFMALESTWRSSFTKFMAFNMTTYDRIIMMDSDSYVLKSMDYLFTHEREIKKTPVSAPVAYWEPKRKNGDPMYTSGLMLVDPSFPEFERVLAASQVRHIQDYDMDLINDEYSGAIDTLPHRGLTMLSSEFRNSDHSGYLGSKLTDWDGMMEIRHVAYIHFSDWPFPKVRFNTECFFKPTNNLHSHLNKPVSKKS